MKWLIALAVICMMATTSAAQDIARVQSDASYQTGEQFVPVSSGYYDQEDQAAEPAQAECGVCECECECECEDDCGCTCYLFGSDEAFDLVDPENNCRGIDIGGWFQFGYHDNPTPLSRARDDGLAFNDVPNALNLQQAWLYMEKAVDGSDCCWDWGYRADVVYGTDAQKTQAFGGIGWDTDWDLGVYGWAIPQAYVEVARGDLNVKVGHFFTLVGYEVVAAPGNFFYSHALTMFNSEPFTHTGALATYKVNDKLEVYGGWTAGWDTGFDSFNNGSNFLGGFGYQVTDWAKFTYINTAGNFGMRGSNAYSHSLLFDVTVTENLNYVLQSDYLSVGSTNEEDLGINQYLFYTINDCLKLGGRFEWWRDDGVDNYEITGGLNYKPHANVTIRPEIRHDWQTGANLDTTTFGIDGYVTF